MLTYFRRDLLRSLQLIFLAGLVLACLGAIVQVALIGRGLVVTVAVLGALAGLRVAEYRRSGPVAPVFDVLELLALAAMLYEVRVIDPLISACYFLLLFRSATGRLRRLVPVLAGYLAVGVGLSHLLAVPIPIGAFLAMPIEALLVYGMRMVLLWSQEQHARQSALLGDVLSRLPFPVIVADPDGAIVLANPAALELTGPLAELRAHNIDGSPLDMLTVAAGAADLELRLTRADGSQSQALLETVPTDQGTIFALRDITAQRLHEEQLWHTAHHDALTGLPNRSLLWQRFIATGSEPYAVLLLDLDGFKAVNDTFGHQAGDELLRGVADRVRDACGPDATVARLGGDEFAVLLPRAGDEQARSTEAAIGDRFRPEFPLTTGPVHIGCSIGYALATPDRSPDEVLAAADAAMYARKHAALTTRP